MQPATLRGSRGPMMEGFGMPAQFQSPHGQQPLAYQPPQFPQNVRPVSQPNQRGQPSPLMQPLASMPPTHQFQPPQHQRRRPDQNASNNRQSYDSPQMGSLSSSNRSFPVPDMGSGSVTRSSMRSSNGSMPDGSNAIAASLQAHSEIAAEQRSLTVQPQAYTILSEIGSGGAGKAFLVRGKEDGMQYIAKQIACLGDKYRPAPASYALHETRLMFLLRHPHIVELLDFYPKSSTYCIIMEYCEQGDLSTQIDSAIRQGNRPFDVDRIYTWWFQILDAIDFCHAKGIIHRDLKPKNIFLDRNFDVKIGDFGVSALVYFPPAAERVGTITYHSPEVQTSLSYSTQSDVWSIGTIMWEAMVLRPSGGEPITLQGLNLAGVAQSYGNAARNLLIQQLQPDPENRPPASYLKEAMLKELATSTRERVAARAAASAAAAKAYVDRQRESMTSKQIPDHILPRPSDMVADQWQPPATPAVADAADIPGTGGSRFSTMASETPIVPDIRNPDLRNTGGALFGSEPPPRAPAPPPPAREREEVAEQPAVAPTDIASRPTIVAADAVQSRSAPVPRASLQAAKPAEVATALPPRAEAAESAGMNDSQRSNDLGIELSAGAGGEYGAWKIARLDPSKGAGRSGEVQVGEFLWEINKKVIFGMPHNSIMGLLKGKPGGKVTLGLKAGLGLPIRHVSLNADGSVSLSPSLSTQAPSPALPPMAAGKTSDGGGAAEAASSNSTEERDSAGKEKEREREREEAASKPAMQGALRAAMEAAVREAVPDQPPEPWRPPQDTRSPSPRPPTAPTAPTASRVSPASSADQNNASSYVPRSYTPPEREAKPESSPAINDRASPQMSPEPITPRAHETSAEAPPSALSQPSRDDSRSGSVLSPPAADRAPPPPTRSAEPVLAEARYRPSAAADSSAQQLAPARASPVPMAAGSLPPLVASRSSPPMENNAAPLPRSIPEPVPLASRSSPATDGQPTYERCASPVEQADGVPIRAVVRTYDGGLRSVADRRSSPPLSQEAHQPLRASAYARELETQTASAPRASQSPGQPAADQPRVDQPRVFRASLDSERPEPAPHAAVASWLNPNPAQHSPVPLNMSKALSPDASQSDYSQAPRSSPAIPRSPSTGTAQIAGEGQYTGELRDGRPFGKGTATWPQQGHTYVGEWRNGVMHGQGTATYLNGDRYDGEWSNGKRSGLGRYAHGSGDVFEGVWANERKDHLGVDTFADGRGYRGEFKENKFAGVGTYFTVDGAMYQGDWFQGKAHGFGISLSSKGGQPAFVQYSHGNLTQSELMGKDEHYQLQERVEQRSVAAVQTALRARRVAASIQGASITAASRDMQDLEREIGDVIRPTTGTSLLGKVVHMLVGINTVVHDDATLAVTSFESDEDGRGMPLSVGDTIIEVSERTCAWYRGMSLEEILVHLQSAQTFWLQLGIRSQSSPDWVRCRVVQVSKREAGFVV